MGHRTTNTGAPGLSSCELVLCAATRGATARARCPIAYSCISLRPSDILVIFSLAVPSPSKGTPLHKARGLRCVLKGGMGRFKCACCSKWWSAGESGSKTITAANIGLMQTVLGDALGQLQLVVGAKVCSNGVAAWNGMVPLVVVAVPLGGAAAQICRAASCAASAHGATRSVESGRLQPQRAAQCWRS